MLFFLVLTFFCSCADEDLFVSMDETTSSVDTNSPPVETIPSDSEETNPSDDSSDSHETSIAPVAVAMVNLENGNLPLEVIFDGSDSSDDNGITDYRWDFPDDSSSNKSTSYTFNEPGVYDIALTVTDSEGLQDIAIVTITVTDPEEVTTETGKIPCSNGGRKANETGLKIWCWNNISIPSGAPGDKDFSGGQLRTAVECSPNQITKVGDRLRFYLNPKTPAVSSWCNNDYNMRAEFRTSPGKIKHPLGTEEWFGWSYTLGDDYIIDKEAAWLFFQAHSGTLNTTPMISLMLVKENGAGSGNAGEIHVRNNTVSSTGSIYPTGIKPLAGQTVNIVMHVVWGDNNNGHLQVWMNGNKVHDKRERTVRASEPFGANAKFGIYKANWRNGSAVQNSLDQGIDHLETFMGPLRIVTRKPGDEDYGQDSYSLVAPN